MSCQDQIRAFKMQLRAKDEAWRKAEDKRVAAEEAVKALEEKLEDLEGRIEELEDRNDELAQELEERDLSSLTDVVVELAPEWRCTKVDPITGHGAIEAATILLKRRRVVMPAGKPRKARGRSKVL